MVHLPPQQGPGGGQQQEGQHSQGGDGQEVTQEPGTGGQEVAQEPGTWSPAGDCRDTGGAPSAGQSASQQVNKNGE